MTGVVGDPDDNRTWAMKLMEVGREERVRLMCTCKMGIWDRKGTSDIEIQLTSISDAR